MDIDLRSISGKYLSQTGMETLTIAVRSRSDSAMNISVWRYSKTNQLLSSQKFKLELSDTDGVFQGFLKSPQFCNEYKEEETMLKECRLSFVGPDAEIWCQVKEYRLLAYNNDLNPREICDPLHSSLFKVLTSMCYKPVTGDLNFRTVDVNGFTLVEKTFHRVDSMIRQTGHVSEMEIMDVNRHFASYRSLLQNENKQVQESEEDEFLYKVCENLEEDLFCKNISESVDIIVDILSEIVSKI